MALPTPFSGIARKGVVAFHRSRLQFLFVLKIEKTACIFMQLGCVE